MRAKDTLARIERLDSPLGARRTDLGKVMSSRLEDAIELFGESPFRTAGGIASTPGIACADARCAIDRPKAGIVLLSGHRKHNRSHCARAVLATLEVPINGAATSDE